MKLKHRVRINIADRTGQKQEVLQSGHRRLPKRLCKNKRMLYILREGELFPIVLSLPTGSLRSFTNYVKSQLSRGRKLSHVVTKITLKKATNSSGIAFSQAVFTFDRMLTADERAAVAGITETVKAYAANLTPASLVEDEPLVDPETGEVVEPLK